MPKIKVIVININIVIINNFQIDEFENRNIGNFLNGNIIKNEWDHNTLYINKI